MTDFDSYKELVRERIDFIEYLRQDGVDLVHQGGYSYRGESPFTTPSVPGRNHSLSVDADAKLWIDFRDTEEFKGDCYDYVMKRKGVGFKGALIELAGFAGVPLTGFSEEDITRHERQQKIFETFGRVADYFHSRLPEEVREVVLRRHYDFSDATIDKFKIGFDDNTLYQGLPDDYQALLETGLVQGRNGGLVPISFFRQRVTFPYSVRERVTFFIGREVASYFGQNPGQVGKYIKLPTSDLVSNEYFYNEDAARGADTLLVTEGVTDCISAAQAGFACISPVTTRFRKQDHPKLIELCGRAKRTTICNDAEDSCAGEKGALDTARALHEAGIDVRLATLPRPSDVEKVDINSFLRTHPPADLQKVIDDAQPYFEFLLSAVPTETPLNELDTKLEPIFAAIAATDGMRGDKYAQMVADRYGVRKATVNTKIKAAKVALSKKQKKSTPAQATARQGKPQIQTNDRQLSWVFADARKAIVEANAARIEEFEIRFTGMNAGIPQGPPATPQSTPPARKSSEDGKEVNRQQCASGKRTRKGKGGGKC